MRKYDTFFDKRKTGGVLGKDFYNKAVPVLLIGLIIWGISTLLYGGYFNIPPLQLDLVGYILLFILYIVLWIITSILAYMKYNVISMILFYISAWITGLLEYPVMVWASGEVGIELAKLLFLIAIIMGIIGVSLALIIGITLRDKIGDSFLIVLLIFGVVLIIVEIVLTLMFGWNTFIFFTSILVLIWIFGMTIWDGSKLPKEIDEGYWMWAVIDLFFDIIIAIVRIFIILVSSDD
jgi:FtsH-binding integral membrane protein